MLARWLPIYLAHFLTLDQWLSLLREFSDEIEIYLLRFPFSLSFPDVFLTEKGTNIQQISHFPPFKGWISFVVFANRAGKIGILWDPFDAG